MKSQKGAAIITILMVLVIIAMLGVVFIETGAGDYIYATVNKNNVCGYFLARAGLEYAADELGGCAPPYEETIEFTTGKCKIVVKEVTGAGMKVECTGFALNSAKGKILEGLISNGVIVNWRQK